jgi:predicted DNA-binding transcriptional regulator YafY
MNRLDRLSAILIQLQSKRVVKAQEITDRFEISLRTVYRDIRSLEQGGIPILSEAGIGYALMKSYKLPPVHFTTEEALSFITAEKLIEKQADTHTQKAFSAALFKIKAILGQNDKDKLEDVNSYIEVRKQVPKQETDKKAANFQEIYEAISERRIIEIEYEGLSDLESQKREIDPIGIYVQGEYWYLVAYCNLRQDYRQFRTDRILDFKTTSKKFSKKHPSVQYFTELKPDTRPLTEVIIEVDQKAYKLIGNQKDFMGFVSQTKTPSSVRMRFLSPSLLGFAHWFLWLGASADIISPVELKELVSEQLQKIKLRLAHE